MNPTDLLIPHGSGWVTTRDPRLRILAAMLFALVTVSLQHPAVLFVAFLFAVALAVSVGLADLWRRLLTLEGFMLILLISLPFTVSGRPVFAFGALAASDAGFALALMILLKANAVVLVLLALIGSLEPMVFGHALARLGVPKKLVHLLLLTIRQIHLLHQEFIRLRQAMRARGFVPRSNRHTWNSYGWLMGMLLVRSLARSRRLLAAMHCRGFRGRLYLLDSSQWQSADSALAFGFILLLGSLTALDWLR